MQLFWKKMRPRNVFSTKKNLNLDHKMKKNYYRPLSCSFAFCLSAQIITFSWKSTVLSFKFFVVWNQWSGPGAESSQKNDLASYTATCRILGYSPCSKFDSTKLPVLNKGHPLMRPFLNKGHPSLFFKKGWFFLKKGENTAVADTQKHGGKMRKKGEVGEYWIVTKNYHHFKFYFSAPLIFFPLE